MFKTKFLRNFLLLSLFIAFVLPLYEIFFISPAYRQLLVEETEDEAVRYARYLVRTLELDRNALAPGNIPAGIAEEVGLLQGDVLLVKLRVFGRGGEILFSSREEEIGQVNNRSYFHDIVARGEVYSKVVEKDAFTAEHQPVKTDVVETYVPIMGDDRFLGAIEIYYDITASSARIDALTRRSVLLLMGISGGFLVLVLVLLQRATQSGRARERAEEALRQAKDRLEGRVAERTGQLLLANQKLSDEIAERTQAQMALAEALQDSEESKEKINGILASVDDGLLVIGAGAKVVLINPAAEELLQVSGDEAIGRPVTEIVPNTELLARLGEVLERQEAGLQFDFELPGRGQQRPRVFQGRTSLFKSGEDSSAGMIILMQDVTNEREVERMKSEFLAMAAHELHTPLTTIIGYAELLSTSREAFPPEQQREFLGYLHEKALALARIVDDLLDISRIEAGQTLNLCCSSFIIDKLVGRIVDRYRDNGRGHRFELEAKPRGIELRGDPGRIEQVLENLLGNAVKYSPADGLIRVAVSLEEGNCVIRISDQGIGMAPEDAAKAFDTFYRVDASDTATHGTGLGLSIARHIVEAHGGSIELKSEPGRGSTFTVLLPLSGPE